MSKHHHNHKKHHHSAVRTGMKATPERHNKQGGLIKEVVDRDATGKVCVEREHAREECVLDFYLLNRKISPDQHQAGMRLREVYICASENLSGIEFGGVSLGRTKYSETDKKMTSYIDGLESLESVWRLLSSTQQKMLRRVCGYNEYAGCHEDMGCLVKGLDALAKHWSIV